MRPLLLIAIIMFSLAPATGLTQCLEYEDYYSWDWFFWIAGSPQDVDLDGELLVAATTGYCHVFRITSPGILDPLSYLGVPGDSRAVDVVGGFAHVAAGPAGVQIIDATNPASPGIAGYVVLPGEANDILVDGEFAYVAGGTGGLHVVSIADPEVPELVGTLGTPGEASGVFKVGDLVYVADGSAGLQIVDVANPGAPTLVGGVATPGTAKAVVVADDHAYLAVGAAAAPWFEVLPVVDVSNPAAPQVVDSQTYQFGVAHEDIDLVNGRLLVSAQNGVAIYEMNGSVIPASDGYVRVGYEQVQGLAVADGHAYLAGGSNALFGIRIDGEGTLDQIDHVSVGGVPQDLALDGDILHVATQDGALHLIDVADPADPALMGVSLDFEDAQGLAVRDGLAYVADSAAGLRIVDVLDPSAPTVVSSLPLAGPAEDVVLLGDHAYVATGEHGLQVVDVCDPAVPVVVGSLDTPAQAHGVWIEDETVYLADNNSLEIIDVAVPATPQTLGSLTLEGVSDVMVAGNLAYVACGWYLAIVDVSEPISPALVSTYQTASTPNAVQVVGTTLYVAEKYGTLQVFDVSDPAAPRSLGAGHAPDRAYSVLVHGDHVYVGTNSTSGRVRVFPSQCPEATAVETTEIAIPTASGVRNYPNPFNPTTTISFAVPGGGTARLTVHDARGRLVRTLIDGPLAAGKHQVQWNGRDDRGREMASGVYLTRLRAAGETGSGRMILVR